MQSFDDWLDSVKDWWDSLDAMEQRVLRWGLVALAMLLPCLLLVFSLI